MSLRDAHVGLLGIERQVLLPRVGGEAQLLLALRRVRAVVGSMPSRPARW